MDFFKIATVFAIVEKKNYRAMPSKTKVVDELESGKVRLVSKCLFCVFNSPKKRTKTVNQRPH